MTDTAIESIVAAILSTLLEWLDRAEPAALTALMLLLTDAQTVLDEVLLTVNAYIASNSGTGTQPSAPVQTQPAPQITAQSSARPIVRGAGNSAPVPKGTIVRHV